MTTAVLVQAQAARNREADRLTAEDKARMVATAARLGDKDAYEAVRLGLAHDPAARLASEIVAAALWEVGGLTVDDLRQVEYEWVLRHVPDAYWREFTRVIAEALEDSA